MFPDSLRDVQVNKSPICDTHKALGAAFTEFHGWEIPSHYGDAVAEHLAVRGSAGIIDMTHRGKIRVSGKDSTRFLHNILSQDINKLTPGTGGHAVLLNTRGHMLAYMRLYSDDDSFLIDTEPGEAEKIIQILNRYLFREDAKIEDLTMQYGLLTVQGPRSRETISRISGIEIKDMDECGHINISINSINCKVARTTYTGEEGYNIYAPWDNLQYIWESIIVRNPFVRHPEHGSVSHRDDIKTMTSGEIIPFGHDAFNSLRIEAGIPLYSIDMDENTIPVEAGLDDAISYTKGCYVGQETIARIKFKGHVNRTLTGFIISPGRESGSVSGNMIIPKKGDIICAAIDDARQEAGFITSACFSPTLNRVTALGYLKIQYAGRGNKVTINSEDGEVSAEVAKLPLYK